LNPGPEDVFGVGNDDCGEETTIYRVKLSDVCPNLEKRPIHLEDGLGGPLHRPAIAKSQANISLEQAVYQPSSFREDRIEVQHQLIREYPLGLLVSAGPDGLMANSVPFLVYEGEGEKGTLRAHVARANLQWKALQELPECLIVFQGPQDYITPSWLATKRETHRVVPTWNYVAVHVWGKARVVEDAAWLFRQLKDLTHAQEGD
jgi:Putative FMN-binding domain